MIRHPRSSGAIASLALLLGALSGSVAQTPQTDWAALARYQSANAQLGPPKAGEQRVVFMGNSITEGWAPLFDTLFPGKPYVGRGISGQTTPQMLVRFRQDVIALKPKVVVILGGTNDIAGNTGPSTLEMIEDNLASMTEIAKANGIRVVLVSVLPGVRLSVEARARARAKDRRAQCMVQAVRGFSRCGLPGSALGHGRRARRHETGAERGWRASERGGVRANGEADGAGDRAAVEAVAERRHGEQRNSTIADLRGCAQIYADEALWFERRLVETIR